MSEVEVPKEFQEESGLRTLANYLRGSHGVKTKTATQHEKRVDYFRGSRLLECIIEEEKELKKWPKTLPKVKDKATALAIANLLITQEFFHRSEKVPDKKKTLRVSAVSVFEESAYYTWMYQGSMMWSNIGAGVLIAVVIGFTLLPIWPDFAKRILWYMSVTFLICTLSFCFIRFMLFLFLWICGYEFWVLPNLFDESLTFYDSFKPIYSFESSAPGQGYYRIGLVVGMVGFVAWAMTQPTEFDSFIQGQKDFLDDLYSGNLIADVAADHKERLDRQTFGGRTVPSFEDLLREIENQERLDAEAHKESATDNTSDADTTSSKEEEEKEKEAQKLQDEILQKEMDDEDAMERLLEELNEQEED